MVSTIRFGIRRWKGTGFVVNTNSGPLGSCDSKKKLNYNSALYMAVSSVMISDQLGGARYNFVPHSKR